MDITETIAPNSEQVNAEDLLAGPQTVTITGVERGTKDQPVFVHLAEYPGRTFRPAKTVRRLLIAAWGAEASAYVGRQLTIYNDPTVKWAGQEIGGVRVSHMSDIDKPLEVLLSVSRGKRVSHVVHPLKAEKPTDPTTHLRKILTAADTLDALKAAWQMVTQQGHSGNRELVALKDERKNALTNPLTRPGE